MPSKDVKKSNILYVLQLLQRETDEEHTLKQTDINQKLELQGVKINRKTLSGLIRELKECGYPIEYQEVNRGNNSIITDIYYDHEFVMPELRMLIDSLLFAGNLPYKQSRDLITKLENLSSVYFKEHVKHSINMTDSKSTNKAFASIYDMIDMAILKGKKIQFNYARFDSDFSLIEYKNNEGKPKTYEVSPYYLTSINGRYYMICGTTNRKVTSYRLDRMRNVLLTNEPRIPVTKCDGYEEGFNLAQYMSKNVYLTPGDIDRVTFRIKKRFLSEVIDWFGDGIKIRDLPREECGTWGGLWRSSYYEEKFAREDPNGISKEYKEWISESDFSWGRSIDKECEIKAQVNMLDMQLFARQHMDYLKIIEPESMVKLIKGDILEAARNYGMINGKNK